MRFDFLFHTISKLMGFYLSIYLRPATYRFQCWGEVFSPQKLARSSAGTSTRTPQAHGARYLGRTDFLWRRTWPQGHVWGEAIAWGIHIDTWLVVWNIFFIFPYVGKNHPNWLIYFRGVHTTNQILKVGFELYPLARSGRPCVHLRIPWLSETKERSPMPWASRVARGSLMCFSLKFARLWKG